MFKKRRHHSTRLLLLRLNSFEMEDFLLFLVFFTPIHQQKMYIRIGWEKTFKLKIKKLLNKKKSLHLPRFFIISFSCWSSSTSLKLIKSISFPCIGYRLLHKQYKWSPSCHLSLSSSSPSTMAFLPSTISINLCIKNVSRCCSSLDFKWSMTPSWLQFSVVTRIKKQ